MKRSVLLAVTAGMLLSLLPGVSHAENGGIGVAQISCNVILADFPNNHDETSKNLTAGSATQCTGFWNGAAVTTGGKETGTIYDPNKQGKIPRTKDKKPPINLRVYNIRYYEDCSPFVGFPVTPLIGGANGDFLLNGEETVDTTKNATIYGHLRYTRIGLFWVTLLDSVESNNAKGGDKKKPTTGGSGVAIGVFIPKMGSQFGDCQTHRPLELEIQGLAITGFQPQ